MSSLCALAALIALASPPAPKVSISWSAPTVAPRSVARATVSVELPDGFHAYANPPSRPELIPLEVRLVDAPKGVRASFRYPEGQLRTLGVDPQPVSVYEGTVRIAATVVAPSNPGRHTLRFKVSLQQCDDAQCFMPQEVEVRTVLVVAGQPPKAQRGTRR
ncbi:MAG: protein-disulfide reductase DsbD domain-containing protein [Fimbriimonadaceae bacterium]